VEVDNTNGESSGIGCFGSFVGMVVLGLGYILLTSFSSVLYCLGLLLGGAIAGVVLRATVDLSAKTLRQMKKAGVITLGLGGAALVTSLLLMVPFGDTGGIGQRTAETVPSTGGTVGPITVDNETWADIEVEQEINPGRGSVYERWSFVTVELLDENKEYLSSFGGEIWNYAGYDGGSRWSQEDETFQATLKLPPGTYYMRLNTEANTDASDLGPIRFQLEPTQWWGNPMPLQWLAYITCFLGAVLLFGAVVEASS